MTERPRPKIVANKIGNAEFFEPRTSTVPLSGTPPWITTLSTSRHSSSLFFGETTTADSNEADDGVNNALFRRMGKPRMGKLRTWGPEAGPFERRRGAASGRGPLRFDDLRASAAGD